MTEVLLWLVIAIVLVGCVLIGYSIWRGITGRPPEPPLPGYTLPEDDEPVWLSGEGLVTYRRAREVARVTHMQVIVSTGKIGPTPDQQYRRAQLEPIFDADSFR